MGQGSVSQTTMRRPIRAAIFEPPTCGLRKPVQSVNEIRESTRQPPNSETAQASLVNVVASGCTDRDGSVGERLPKKKWHARVMCFSARSRNVSVARQRTSCETDPHGRDLVPKGGLHIGGLLKSLMAWVIPCNYCVEGVSSCRLSSFLLTSLMARLFLFLTPI